MASSSMSTSAARSSASTFPSALSPERSRRHDNVDEQDGVGKMSFTAQHQAQDDAGVPIPNNVTLDDNHSHKQPRNSDEHSHRMDRRSPRKQGADHERTNTAISTTPTSNVLSDDVDLIHDIMNQKSMTEEEYDSLGFGLTLNMSGSSMNGDDHRDGDINLHNMSMDYGDMDHPPNWQGPSPKVSQHSNNENYDTIKTVASEGSREKPLELSPRETRDACATRKSSKVKQAERESDDGASIGTKESTKSKTSVGTKHRKNVSNGSTSTASTALSSYSVPKLTLPHQIAAMEKKQKLHADAQAHHYRSESAANINAQAAYKAHAQGGNDRRGATGTERGRAGHTYQSRSQPPYGPPPTNHSQQRQPPPSKYAHSHGSSRAQGPPPQPPNAHSSSKYQQYPPSHEGSNGNGPYYGPSSDSPRHNSSSGYHNEHGYHRQSSQQHSQSSRGPPPYAPPPPTQQQSPHHQYSHSHSGYYDDGSNQAPPSSKYSESYGQGGHNRSQSYPHPHGHNSHKYEGPNHRGGSGGGDNPSSFPYQPLQHSSADSPQPNLGSPMSHSTRGSRSTAHTHHTSRSSSNRSRKRSMDVRSPERSGHSNSHHSRSQQSQQRQQFPGSSGHGPHDQNYSSSAHGSSVNPHGRHPSMLPPDVLSVKKSKSNDGTPTKNTQKHHSSHPPPRQSIKREPGTSQGSSHASSREQGKHPPVPSAVSSRKRSTSSSEAPYDPYNSSNFLRPHYSSEEPVDGEKKHANEKEDPSLLHRRHASSASTASSLSMGGLSSISSFDSYTGQHKGTGENINGEVGQDAAKKKGESDRNLHRCESSLREADAMATNAAADAILESESRDIRRTGSHSSCGTAYSKFDLLSMEDASHSGSTTNDGIKTSKSQEEKGEDRSSDSTASNRPRKSVGENIAELMFQASESFGASPLSAQDNASDSEGSKQKTRQKQSKSKKKQSITRDSHNKKSAPKATQNVPSAKLDPGMTPISKNTSRHRQEQRQRYQIERNESYDLYRRVYQDTNTSSTTMSKQEEDRTTQTTAKRDKEEPFMIRSSDPSNSAFHFKEARRQETFEKSDNYKRDVGSSEDDQQAYRRRRPQIEIDTSRTPLPKSRDREILSADNALDHNDDFLLPASHSRDSAATTPTPTSLLGEIGPPLGDLKETQSERKFRETSFTPLPVTEVKKKSRERRCKTEDGKEGDRKRDNDMDITIQPNLSWSIMDTSPLGDMDATDLWPVRKSPSKADEHSPELERVNSSRVGNRQDLATRSSSSQQENGKTPTAEEVAAIALSTLSPNSDATNGSINADVSRFLRSTLKSPATGLVCQTPGTSSFANVFDTTATTPTPTPTNDVLSSAIRNFDGITPQSFHPGNETPAPETEPRRINTHHDREQQKSHAPERTAETSAMSIKPMKREEDNFQGQMSPYRRGRRHDRGAQGQNGNSNYHDPQSAHIHRLFVTNNGRTPMRPSSSASAQQPLPHGSQHPGNHNHHHRTTGPGSMGAGGMQGPTNSNRSDSQISPRLPTTPMGSWGGNEGQHQQMQHRKPHNNAVAGAAAVGNRYGAGGEGNRYDARDDGNSHRYNNGNSRPAIHHSNSNGGSNTHDMFRPRSSSGMVGPSGGMHAPPPPSAGGKRVFNLRGSAPPPSGSSGGPPPPSHHNVGHPGNAGHHQPPSQHGPRPPSSYHHGGPSHHHNHQRPTNAAPPHHSGAPPPPVGGGYAHHPGAPGNRNGGGNSAWNMSSSANVSNRNGGGMGPTSTSSYHNMQPPPHHGRHPHHHGSPPHPYGGSGGPSSYNNHRSSHYSTASHSNRPPSTAQPPPVTHHHHHHRHGHDPRGIPHRHHSASSSVPPGPLPPGPHNRGPPVSGSNSAQSSALANAVAVASRRRCEPLKGPIPSKFQGDINKFKDAPIPEFTNLVNFPANVASKLSAMAGDGLKVCVMCGSACPCNSGTSKKSGTSGGQSGGSGSSRGPHGEHTHGLIKHKTVPNSQKLHHTGNPNGALSAANGGGGANGCYAIIPTQNKGLCTFCDVNVWVVVDSRLQIKWCKGCKNFRPWAAFGEKGLATKCVRCRERQREKYALQKEEKEKARMEKNQTTLSSMH